MKNKYILLFLFGFFGLPEFLLDPEIVTGYGSDI